MLVGVWAAFLVCFGLILASVFSAELRSEIMSGGPAVLGLPVALFSAGFVAGASRPILRSNWGAYLVGGTASTTFFTVQFIVGGLAGEMGTGAMLFLASLTFFVGALMTPLYRYGLRTGGLYVPDFDGLMESVWNTPKSGSNKEDGRGGAS